MVTSNFHLFAANGKQKQQTSVCLLQTEMKIEVCLDGKLESANMPIGFIYGSLA
jgi:hypothetical protein